MHFTPISLFARKVASLILIGFLLTSFTSPYVHNGDFDKDVSNFNAILPTSIRTIVIDAGHGGKDNGCKHQHTVEKHINLKIATALAKLLKAQYPNLNIIFTRNDDQFVSLDRRIDVANQNNGDLFISIHCNYVKERHVSGTELFVLGNATSSISTDHYLSHEITGAEDAQIGHHDFAQSMDLALAMNKALDDSSRLKNRGIKQAPFTVLKKAKMPSILIETGFLSNPRDLRFLNSEQGQVNFAKTILEGFSDYCVTVKEREEVAHTPVVVKYPKAVKKYVKPAVVVLAQNPAQNLAYRIVLQESKTIPTLSTSVQWKNLGTLEIIEEAGVYKLISEKFVDLDQALAKKEILLDKGFKNAQIIRCFTD